jgi:pimeloyl-ACP methyl ester carboxylesterase
VRSRHVQANGVSLFTEAFGAPDDPAVLLVMGAMASGVWWPEELCEALAARGRHVVRYDHRDTGRSTSYAPGAGTYTVEDLAWDAVGILDAFGMARAHLVGMSLGGYLCQLVALAHPQRVRTLTLVSSERLAATDPRLPGMDPAVVAYHAKGAELDWTDREAVLEYQLGAWRLLGGSAHPFDEESIRALALADLERTPDLRTTFNHARLRDAAGWLDRLDEVKAPALVIHGTEDPVLPYAHGLALHAALPGSRLLTLPGSGHELHRADWPVILDAIEEHTAA